MSEVTDLVVIEKTNALAVFKSSDQIEEIIQKVEREVLSFVPDTSTAKGRKEIASLAYRVAQTKTYLDSLGKDLVAELKEIPKLIDGNRRTVRERLDALKEKARKPLTDYEAEIERIAAEEERLRIEAEAKKAAEELAKEIEMAHREALIDNYEFDRALEEAKAEAERQCIAHEEELKRQAAEQARLDAETKAKAEIEAANKREADAKAAAEAAERQRIEAQQRAECEAKEALERAERERVEALQRSEREKQKAIEVERLKAQQEADRIKREAEAKEAARLAEEKRIADEKARREADENHRKVIGTAIVNALLANVKIDRVQAIQVLTALKDGKIPHTTISY